MIQTKNISYRYPLQKNIVFNDIKLFPSESLLVTGNSGSGKTTLLHLLCGLLKPQNGQIFINGIDISSLKDYQTDRFRGKHIGIVFQSPAFIESLSVLENIQLHSWLATGKKASSHAIINILLQMGVEDQAKKLPSNLSLGERQRIGIARAIINKPKVLLADEPTSNLDDKHTRKVTGLLLETVQQLKTSLIVVTHDHRLNPYFPNQIEL